MGKAAASKPGSIASSRFSRTQRLRVSRGLGNVAIDQDATRPDTRGGGVCRGQDACAFEQAHLPACLPAAVHCAPHCFLLIYNRSLQSLRLDLCTSNPIVVAIPSRTVGRSSDECTLFRKTKRRPFIPDRNAFEGYHVRVLVSFHLLTLHTLLRGSWCVLARVRVRL